MTRDERGRLDWGEVLRRITLYAHRRLRGQGGWDQAEDFAADACSRLLAKRERLVEIGTEAELLRHLGSEVNGLVANHFRSFRVRRVDFLDDPDTAGSVAPLALREADPRVERLRVLCVGDELALACLDLHLAEDIHKPREQAAALGVDIVAIRNVRRRLKDRARTISSEEK